VSTCAIVVTYNRKELLEECLEAVFAQTVPPDEVLVIDNASTDGTPELVRERFPQAHLERLPENIGGAGGFHRGLELGHANGHDWLWLMDDDTIANPDALAELHAGAERAPARPALVASQVQWTDGSLHPMNRPHPRWQRMADLAEGARHGLVLLRTATFVSVMISRETVDRHGLPLARYFIWSDDTEYTARALRSQAGYLVPESVAVHKTRTPHTAIEDASGRFYYHVRNSLLLLRGTSYAPSERLVHARYFVLTIKRYLARNHWRATSLAVVARGAKDGLTWPVR
jgi:rhamnopyranosyl-N-acetylglucosaminyl-diphospho-decaprenol beta-1,3/1,4-galactofuranosyltransferase